MRIRWLKAGVMAVLVGGRGLGAQTPLILVQQKAIPIDVRAFS